jgi:hypothetical protein
MGGIEVEVGDATDEIDVARVECFAQGLYAFGEFVALPLAGGRRPRALLLLLLPEEMPMAPTANRTLAE